MGDEVDARLRRVLFAGGGTGGHVYPGLAVIEALGAGYSGVECHWVGTPDRMEARIVPSHGVPFHPLSVRFLKGTTGLRRWVALLSLPGSVVRAVALLVRTRAGVVVALGGFVCGPVALAAWLLRRPVVLLEQNAVPGMTGRAIGRFARRVFASFEDTGHAFPPERVVVAGNPVRARLIRDVEARRGASRNEEGGVRVLVFGGSQGARSLNRELPFALASALVASGRRAAVRHVAGPGNEADARSAWESAVAAASRGGELAVEVHVDGYVDDMAGAYAEADVVVCRAGATTLAELAALGLPSVLIPFPWAADDHQTANAEAFVRAGAAVRIADDEVAASDEALRAVLTDPERLQAMGESARALGRPDAAGVIAAEVASLLELTGTAGGVR